MNINEIWHVIRLPETCVPEASNRVMDVLCCCVMRFLSSVAQIFFVRSILRNGLLHRSQVELGTCVTFRNLFAGSIWILCVSYLLDNSLIVDSLWFFVLKRHLEVDVLQIRLNIGFLCIFKQISVHVVNLVNLSVFSFSCHVRLSISVFGCRWLLFHYLLVHFCHCYSFVKNGLHLWLRRIMLDLGNVEQLLSVQIICGVPLFGWQTEVVIFFAKSPRISLLTRVLFRPTTPRDVCAINLFIGCLSLLCTRVCQLLAIFVRNRLDQLVKRVSVRRILALTYTQTIDRLDNMLKRTERDCLCVRRVFVDLALSDLLVVAFFDVDFFTSCGPFHCLFT